MNTATSLLPIVITKTLVPLTSGYYMNMVSQTGNGGAFYLDGVGVSLQLGSLAT